MSGIGIGDYLSAMRSDKEQLLSRFLDFWNEIYVKARDSRHYTGHITVSDHPNCIITLEGTGISLTARNRVVFYGKQLLLEMEFYRESKDKDESILKIYLANDGRLFLGHPDDVESIDFYYDTTDVPFFEKLIQSLSNSGFISIDRQPAHTPS
ncbi:hypothetical protein AWI06_09040 [Enterobacter hormaechei subsp. xiangfangensis]|uniref:hypothetical protein n=1 Tax=Enterobacter hormaechei TaxID=158836 RepID=UPI0007504505|nr:hypothetical protein [Enterobacter hormaechei]KUQ12336.1 hypothetical protein AWI06_09040 [Enterobacter hormaechei subsp. xiangfangensis]